VFDEGTATLWLGVAAIGAWHGLNPAMGWPLAVANGLTEQRGAAVLATFIPLGMGHLLAIASVLMPFALLSWLLTWNLELRIAAGCWCCCSVAGGCSGAIRAGRSGCGLRNSCCGRS
jgi:hypothetical protein